jgi:hypothetical protein
VRRQFDFSRGLPSVCHAPNFSLKRQAKSPENVAFGIIDVGTDR